MRWGRKREMGPALRLTPLSPARGPRGALGGPASRSRFRQALASTEGRVRYRPALAPVPVPSGAGVGPKVIPYRPAVPRPMSSTWVSNGFRFARRRCELLDTKPANAAFPTLRPCGFNGLGFGWPQDEPLSCSASHPSTTRHLAVASIRFQNPFFLAGLSAFVSEGPIPVSMFGRCAVQPIRATAGPPIYPHST